MSWIGRKRVAFIPLYRTRAIPPDQIPPDWSNLILSRVLFDPDPQLSGADGSLRAWVRAASSGRADIDPVILPMQTIDRQDVLPDALESDMGGRLRDQGFDHAAIVMLGDIFAGSNRGFWSRFVMAEHTGVWAMEIIHGIAGFRDLYYLPGYTDPSDRAIDRFDQMSHSALSHPTAYTKAALGWLDQSAIVRHSGPQTDYELQWIGLPQNPTSGRAAAVRIGDTHPYMMVEARKMNDQFETGVRRGFDRSKTPGIPGDGVIVYRVQTTDSNGGSQNNQLPVYLLTKKALAPGESAVVDDGALVTNTGLTVGGNTVRIEMPAQHVIDRSAAVGAPSAAGAPTSCVIPGLGVENIAFKDGAGNLHELWRDGRGNGTTNLTANAGAPKAAGDPFAYVDPTTNSVILLYRGGDNNVHSLYWSTGAVGHDNLTGSVNAPKAAGDPVGWWTPDNVHHVVYRSADGHLRELWWQGPGAVQHGDLTALAGATPAAGDPSVYFDPVRGTNIVAFRGTDGRIRSLYWSGGPVGQDDLSGTAQMPNAAGDPWAYFSQADDTHHVTYRATTGHVIELA